MQHAQTVLQQVTSVGAEAEARGESTPFAPPVGLALLLGAVIASPRRKHCGPERAESPGELPSRRHGELPSRRHSGFGLQTPVFQSFCFLGAPLRLPVQRLVPLSFPTD